MGALWWMNNEKYMGMPAELKRVVTDGFYALQQADIRVTEAEIDPGVLGFCGGRRRFVRPNTSRESAI